jgi:hypothetical protein
MVLRAGPGDGFLVGWYYYWVGKVYLMDDKITVGRGARQPFVVYYQLSRSEVHDSSMIFKIIHS